MKMKIVQKPTVFIVIEEVGNYYIDRLMVIKTDRCTLEEAKKEARDAGYQVIDDLCSIVHTAHEVQITVAVEPEYIKGGYIMVKGGINCFGCDLDYDEGYWLEIEGEEPIFFCKECAERANLIGKPGVYEHTEEEEEEEEVTWTEIMNKAWHLALNSGTFTDNPKEKAGDVYLVKDIKLVVEAFARDIEEGKLNSYEDPASFLDAHGIEWE